MQVSLGEATCSTLSATQALKMSAIPADQQLGQRVFDLGAVACTGAAQNFASMVQQTNHREGSCKLILTCPGALGANDSQFFKGLPAGLPGGMRRSEEEGAPRA